jgi:hypothetical protein
VGSSLLPPAFPLTNQSINLSQKSSSILDEFEYDDEGVMRVSLEPVDIIAVQDRLVVLGLL